ncbi:hypothetical protein N7495_004432 [Penicillium taxi]|uniref:uncharacterized protein n=1 Tax=Penicillium taxi TaxID=168475 RepID=UPI00254579A9|nr:uncharacterized protein N7495_004432 [Penicillium taxi]KAJ5899688.1 hypothetical protein N7495_004432 [Penicillium taxi]
MSLSEISAQLSESPKRFPDCCFGISTTFIKILCSILPQCPGFTLSVGSGSGLLEGLIAFSDKNISVQGVEVDSSINRYIDEEAMHVVGGGWGLSSYAKQAKAWMFVYPRDPKLISKYIDLYGGHVELIVWLGPKVDWPDYEPCFLNSSFWVEVLDAGLTPYETAVVVRRS